VLLVRLGVASTVLAKKPIIQNINQCVARPVISLIIIINYNNNRSRRLCVFNILNLVYAIDDRRTSEQRYGIPCRLPAGQVMLAVGPVSRFFLLFFVPFNALTTRVIRICPFSHSTRILFVQTLYEFPPDHDFGGSRNWRIIVGGWGVRGVAISFE